MKKLLIICSSFFLVLGLQAQDDAAKMLKKASRALGSYNLAPSSSMDKLDEAKALIEKVMASSDMKENGKAHMAKGKIYNELFSKDIKTLALNQEAELAYDGAGIMAFEGFSNALKFAEKGFEKKEALKGINDLIGNINYLGSVYYQRQKFVKAHSCFEITLKANEMLATNGEEAYFSSDSARMEQMYYSGVAALSGDMKDEATAKFQALYDMNYENPGVYEALYKIKKETDKASAEEILSKGRTDYPDDLGLLYAEINYYLSEGRLNELTGKLEVALEKEPDNLSVMTTLGNVYDQLYQKATAEENEAEAEVNFNKALKYYNKALEKDPEYFDATYSVGALYYNKAASLTQQMNALADDYSKEGSAKYEKAKLAMEAMFDQAMPYFQKAEALNPNDINTLIALKEIFARKNDFDKAGSYKDRIEALEGGE